MKGQLQRRFCRTELYFASSLSGSSCLFSFFFPIFFLCLSPLSLPSLTSSYLPSPFSFLSRAFLLQLPLTSSVSSFTLLLLPLSLHVFFRAFLRLSLSYLLSLSSFTLLLLPLSLHVFFRAFLQLSSLLPPLSLFIHSPPPSPIPSCLLQSFSSTLSLFLPPLSLSSFTHLLLPFPLHVLSRAFSSTLSLSYLLCLFLHSPPPPIYPPPLASSQLHDVERTT